MLKQVSIFAENKKGALHEVLELLAAKNVNIDGFVTNDSAEFGIVRLITKEAEEAGQALEAAGYQYRVRNVIGVEIEDKPGALDKLLVALEEMNVNVDYLYISYNRDNARPIMVLHTEGMPEVESALASRGFCVK